MPFYYAFFLGNNDSGKMQCFFWLLVGNTSAFSYEAKNILGRK